MGDNQGADWENRVKIAQKKGIAGDLSGNGHGQEPENLKIWGKNSFAIEEQSGGSISPRQKEG